jgi:hypothetical protein
MNDAAIKKDAAQFTLGAIIAPQIVCRYAQTRCPPVPTPPRRLRLSTLTRQTLNTLLVHYTGTFMIGGNTDAPIEILDS